MANAAPILKRHNHRVHPCKTEKKEELLKLLLEKNAQNDILVVTSQKTELSTEFDNVTILSDEELAKATELKVDLLISYDLPDKAITYMSRLAYTKTHALILLDPSEEKSLHPIETLNGRTIMQELVEGFSEIPEVKQAQPKRKEDSNSKPREFKSYGDKKPWDDKGKKPYKKDDSRGGKKPWEDKEKKPWGDKEKKPWDDKAKKPFNKDDNRGDRKPWDKKEKTESKYIGVDENGKALFSGKSGERNHHYDGTPKARPPRLTGKKISIKALKKKDSE